jgi:hypothetical protein
MDSKSLKQLEAERLAAMAGPQHDWLVGHGKKGHGRHILSGLGDNLFSLDREAIIKLFPPAVRSSDDPKQHPKSPVNDAMLMRTLIWQVFLLTLAGQRAPLEGNLRSCWYQIVEPFYTMKQLLELPAGPSALLLLDTTSLLTLFRREQKEEETLELYGSISEGGRHGAYVLGLMAACFDEFIFNRIFTFVEPFKFFDPRSNFHIIGQKTPSFVLFTEKEGLWKFIQRLAKEKGISAMASHGEAGLLTLEYFTNQLKGHYCSYIRLCALNDFDPWGWEIGVNAKRNMQLNAFGNVEEDGSIAPLQVDLHRLTTLDLFDKNIIQMMKRDLSTQTGGKAKEVQDWMNQGGGIDGKPYSLHVDNANHDKITQAFNKWYADGKNQAEKDKRKPHPERRDPGLKSLKRQRRPKAT